MKIESYLASQLGTWPDVNMDVDGYSYYRTYAPAFTPKEKRKLKELFGKGLYVHMLLHVVNRTTSWSFEGTEDHDVMALTAVWLFTCS